MEDKNGLNEIVTKKRCATIIIFLACQKCDGSEYIYHVEMKATETIGFI